MLCYVFCWSIDTGVYITTGLSENNEQIILMLKIQFKKKIEAETLFDIKINK
jgi:hypothetical protein